MVLTVGIICVNGKEEQIFIDALKRSSERHAIVFEYTENENISPLGVHLTLRKYKERKLPIVVLISGLFLETVIPSAYKSSILKDVLKWVSDYVVHVWLGNLKEPVVKSYSTALCRTNGNFRKVCESDLPLRITAWAGSIRDLIQDTTPKFSRKNFDLENHDVIYDYVDEKKFGIYKSQRSVPSMSTDDSMIKDDGDSGSNKPNNEKKSSISNVIPPVSTQKKSKKKKPKAANVYSQAASDSYGLFRDNIPADESKDLGALEDSASSNNQRKKKSKRRTLSSPVRDLSYGQLNTISLLLDIGYGANWKQVAGLFRIEKPTIENIELALKRSESPSMTLFNLLGVRRPELTLGELVDACKFIARQDVVQAIEKDILKGSLVA